MNRKTREIAWIKAAKKDFGKFPVPAQRKMARALTVAAEGGKADIAKPMKGLGAGVYEIALAYHSDAYRAIYALHLDDAIWVLHAFQKKASIGIKTPLKEIDLIRERIKRLKEQLR
jgi:phage-related protein